MARVLFIGDRLFMKFPNFDFFKQRLGEIGAEFVSTHGMSDEEIVQEAKNAAALVVIGRHITREMIHACSDCKIIMTLSVGYDVVDVAAATEKRIPVSNCPSYCSDEVAEHALTLALALSRKLHSLREHVQSAGWDYKQARTIHSYRTQTYGVFGLGRIGRKGAAKAKALGMRVTAYDPYVDDDIFELLGIERRYEFNEFLATADVVTIHSPLTDETYHMFDKNAFEQMKENAIIVNTARGAIIDRAALENALDAGSIGGAGIDVLEIEPPQGDEPLLNHPRAIVTPHIAWYSEESHNQNMLDGMDELTRALTGKRPRYVVNPQIFARRQ